MLFLQLLVVFLVTVVLTGIFRKYALWRNVMDIPNERSSHSIPTPRGGGIAMVLVYLFALAYQLNITGFSNEQLALLVGGGVIALTGFLDDHHSLAARWRLLIQILVSVMMVVSAGELPTINILNRTVQPDIVAYPLLVLTLVWMTNLYNFMDGIDGLSGTEAVSVCFIISIIYKITGFIPNDGIAVLLLASSVAGFLVWNFPPARIFMGDVGSGFIGLLLGGLMLRDADKEPKFLFVWLILLGVFIVDATMTLFYRIYKKERFYEAHCTHAFQYASRIYGSHKKVTLSVLMINLFWLAPMALIVAMDWISELVGFTIAYTPLLVLWATLRYQGAKRDVLLRNSGLSGKCNVVK